MKILSLAIAFFFAILLNACIDLGERVDGNGRIRTEARKIREVERIKVAGDIDVYIDHGPQSLKVEAEDNLLPYILTDVHDDWLEIRTRDNVNLNKSTPIKVYLTTPTVTDMKVTGSGNIESRSKFSTDHNTRFDISGSGDIRTTINAPKVEARISGSGNLHLAGETRDVEIHISGSGNYDGVSLKSENANVSIAGSGDAALFADHRLRASIAGSGNVKYRGNATIESHIAGSGSVTKE